MMSDVETGKTPMRPSVIVIGGFRKAVGKFSTIGRGVIQRAAVSVIEQQLKARFPAPGEANLQGIVNRVGIGRGETNRVHTGIGAHRSPDSVKDQSSIRINRYGCRDIGVSHPGQVHSPGAGVSDPEH